jgi:hypothetical protein
VESTRQFFNWISWLFFFSLFSWTAIWVGGMEKLMPFLLLFSGSLATVLLSFSWWIYGESFLLESHEKSLRFPMEFSHASQNKQTPRFPEKTTCLKRQKKINSDSISINLFETLNGAWHLMQHAIFLWREIDWRLFVGRFGDCWLEE